MNERENETVKARLALRQYADAVLGEREWFLLSNYGKLTTGPDSGRYVSSLPSQDARIIIDALLRGDLVGVHLMHRHCSGEYVRSRLRLRAGRLELVFSNRIEPA